MNPSPEILYAPATAEDIPGVVELCMLVEAQHEAYWLLRWQRRAGLQEGYTGWLTRRLTEPRMLIHVARDTALPPGHQVVGMVLGTIEKEIPIYTYTEFAFIHDLAIRESHRRRGIATRLLAAAADWARSHNLNQLRLMVAHQNPDARLAFEKAGFRHTYDEMVLPLQQQP